jgi:lipoprotein signal peptidase
MPRLPGLLLLLAALVSLTGCGMLASVYEDRTLRTGALLVLIGAAVGFIVARMRRR